MGSAHPVAFATGTAMLGYIRFADSLSAWFGKVFAWSIMIMTIGMAYEVVVRYLFRAPTAWAYDVGYMLYGTLFMMAGAYTLSRDGHVRGDFIYRLWRPRTQAAVELALYFLFFFPGVLALIFAGWKYAARSWRYLEVSTFSPAGILLFLQGIAQVFRCIVCLRTGAWIRAEEDVEETDKMLIEAHSHDAHGGEALDIPSGLEDEVKAARNDGERK